MSVTHPGSFAVDYTQPDNPSNLFTIKLSLQNILCTFFLLFRIFVVFRKVTTVVMLTRGYYISGQAKTYLSVESLRSFQEAPCNMAQKEQHQPQDRLYKCKLRDAMLRELSLLSSNDVVLVRRQCEPNTILYASERPSPPQYGAMDYSSDSEVDEEEGNSDTDGQTYLDWSTSEAWEYLTQFEYMQSDVKAGRLKLLWFSRQVDGETLPLLDVQDLLLLGVSKLKHAKYLVKDIRLLVSDTK